MDVGAERRRTPVWVIARGPTRWDDMSYLRRLSPGGPGERPRGTRRPSPVAAPPRGRVRRSPPAGTPPLEEHRGGLRARSGPPRELPSPERVLPRGGRPNHASPVPRPATHARLRASIDRAPGWGHPHLLSVGSGRRPDAARPVVLVGTAEGREPPSDGLAAERSGGPGRSPPDRRNRRRIGRPGGWARGRFARPCGARALVRLGSARERGRGAHRRKRGPGARTGPRDGQGFEGTRGSDVRPGGRGRSAVAVGGQGPLG